MFTPISTILGVLFFASTLPNGVRLIELPAHGDSIEIIAGYDEPGLAGLASTPAARSLIFNAYAAGGEIQLINQRDRTALRFTIPQWALPMLADRQLSDLFRDPPKGIERPENAVPSSTGDSRAMVEEEIRGALLGSLSVLPEYSTDHAFVAISAPPPGTLRDALAAIPRRASANRPEDQISRLPAERTLRFKLDLPTGAVIFAAPVPSVYYREWYLVLFLDRVIHRAVQGSPRTELLPSLNPYYYRLEIALSTGQFPETVEENLLQELQRLQLSGVDSQRLSAARQETLAYLDSTEVREWFAERGISERLEEGRQWVQSMTMNDLRAAMRDLLLMNRVIATWPPKPRQTTVEVENLGGESRPSTGASSTRRPLAEGEGKTSEVPIVAFPTHKDPPQNVDVPQRLASGVSLVVSNINGVFVSGGTFTKYDHEPDAGTVRSFEKYSADRILALAPPGSMDHARELWSSFKGTANREAAVPKGPVSGGDLPAVYVLKTILELKVIQAGWWSEVELRIDAGEGASLQISAEPGRRERIIEWIKEFGAHAPPDKDFAWMREVAVHRFDTVRPGLQALTWEQDPQGTLQDIETIVPKFVQDVAQIYF